MAQRVSRSARTPKLLVGLAACLLLGGGYAARQAVSGHGRWRLLAAGLYHQYRAARLQKAYAAEIPRERADVPMVIYGAALGDGWQDRSWAAHGLQAAAPAHGGGGTALVFSPGNNQGVYLHHDALGTGGFGALQFQALGHPRVNVCLVGADGRFLPSVSLARFARPDGHGRAGWDRVRIPLTMLGAAGPGAAITGVVFRADGTAPQPPAALGGIVLLPDATLPPAPTAATVAVSVDPGADRHAISPLIYGMAFAPADYLRDLRLGLDRWGGNDKSRYDWALGNADNAARDWRFADRTAYGGAPNGHPSSAADAFVRQDRLSGAETLLTVPTLGWVARDADNASASQGVPGAGGPPLAGADGPIPGYDPADNRRRTSVRSQPRKGRPFSDNPTLADGVVYQDEWIHHLVGAFGPAGAGGVRFYAMDNEPDLWDNTHTDIHPARMGYDDILRCFLDYATAVKDVDAGAQITGPVVSGWTGYEFSPLDRGDDNFRTHADQNRHGGVWLLPWFLAQVHEHDFHAGRRSLDVLDVHFYPQGAGVYGGGADADTQARRLRATRALWDPGYTDESWIGQPVRLIPRLREWVGQDYPGTKIGLTEWNFGGETDISGGLAVADALGIFGRERLDLADYWAFPPRNSPAFLAFKLFRNADGHGHGFGDVGCRAASADPDRVSCFAATDAATGDLTVMLINKMPKATVTAPLTVPGLAAGTAIQKYRLAADNPRQIVSAPAAPVSGPRWTETLPPYSITLLRIPRKGGPPR